MLARPTTIKQARVRRISLVSAVAAAAAAFVREPRLREPYWSLNLYREAGEAGGCVRVPALLAIPP